MAQRERDEGYRREFDERRAGSRSWQRGEEASGGTRSERAPERRGEFHWPKSERGGERQERYGGEDDHYDRQSARRYGEHRLEPEGGYERAGEYSDPRSRGERDYGEYRDDAGRGEKYGNRGGYGGDVSYNGQRNHGPGWYGGQPGSYGDRPRPYDDQDRYEVQDRDRGRGSYGGQGAYGGTYGWASQIDVQRRRRRGPKGYKRSDERLKEDIAERLMYSWEIDASDVSIDVQNGKVTLEGTVPERRMKHAIEDIVDNCLGVEDIDNRVRVARPGEESSSGSDSGGNAGGAGVSGSSGTSKTE